MLTPPLWTLPFFDNVTFFHQGICPISVRLSFGDQHTFTLLLLSSIPPTPSCVRAFGKTASKGGFCLLAEGESTEVKPGGVNNNSNHHYSYSPN